MSTFRTPLFAVSALVLGVLGSTACEYGSASGDRRLSGECPEKACAESTPAGLIFYGQTLYDDEADRLGPVAHGGTFLLRFGVPEGEIGGWDVEAVPEGILQVTRTGTRSIVVEGIQPGSATIRVFDPETGALYDQLPFRGVKVDAIEVGNAKSDRDYLVAGCPEMVGIDLFHEAGRAFDLDVSMTVNGEAIAERWDCYQVDVPTGITELEFVIQAGVDEQVVTMPVVAGACLSYYE